MNKFQKLREEHLVNHRKVLRKNLSKFIKKLVKKAEKKEKTVD